MARKAAQRARAGAPANVDTLVAAKASSVLRQRHSATGERVVTELRTEREFQAYKEGYDGDYSEMLWVMLVWAVMMFVLVRVTPFLTEGRSLHHILPHTFLLVAVPLGGVLLFYCISQNSGDEDEDDSSANYEYSSLGSREPAEPATARQGTGEADSPVAQHARAGGSKKLAHKYKVMSEDIEAGADGNKDEEEVDDELVNDDDDEVESSSDYGDDEVESSDYGDSAEEEEEEEEEDGGDYGESDDEDGGGEGASFSDEYGDDDDEDESERSGRGSGSESNKGGTDGEEDDNTESESNGETGVGKEAIPPPHPDSGAAGGM
jgi:hypothetical protein